MTADALNRLGLATLGAWLGTAIWVVTQVLIGNGSQIWRQVGFIVLAVLAIALTVTYVVNMMRGSSG